MEAQDGYMIQVGDKILKQHGLGDKILIVSRVTPKWAFVRHSDIFESKFRREYHRFGFGPIPRHGRSPITYSVLAPTAPAPTPAQS